MNVKFDKDGWPTEIPWPTEGEWTVRAMTDGAGRCCLLGWMHVAFTGQPHRHTWSPEAEAAVNAVGRVAERKAAALQFQTALHRACARRGFVDDGFQSGVALFNNDLNTTDADRTAVWAEAAAECDYHEAS